jgi:septal ring factor EnvC (AmiA/AmiB activator)
MIKRSSGKTTVLLVILIIMSLGLAGGLFYLFQQAESSNRILTEQLDEARAQYAISEQKVKESENILQQKDLQLQDAIAKIDTLTSEIKQEQEAKKVAQEELAKVKSDLTTQQSLRVKLEGELNAAQGALKKAQAQLTELEGKKNLLESKIGDLEQNTKKEDSDVELGTIVVAPETQAPAATKVTSATKKTATSVSQKALASPSEGKVLVVNKEYNFAVINLGSKDGVAMGDVFYVYHNNKYIGDITLEKIHDSMAAAGFASSNIEKKIAEGDRVVKKKTR